MFFGPWGRRRMWRRYYRPWGGPWGWRPYYRRPMGCCGCLTLPLLIFPWLFGAIVLRALRKRA